MRYFLISSFFLLTLILIATEEPQTETAVAAEPGIVYIPIVLNNFDPQFPAPPLGVQTYGNSANTSPYHSALIDSGANWVRSRIQWRWVEPTNTDPASFNWAQADNALEATRVDRERMNFIITIDFAPDWALLDGVPGGRLKPEALDDFAEFLQATVERYDGDGNNDAPGQPTVKHWELYNEPDDFTRWGNYGAEYAQMLEVAYTAIKAADPSAQVLFGGIAYDNFNSFNRDFFDDVLAAGGGDYFDIMNFHIYPAFASNWGTDATGMKGKTADIRAKLAAYNLEKPIVITETGWYSNPNTSPPSSLAEQVDRLVHVLVHSFAIDSKITIWFMLFDPGGIPDFGLVENASISNPPVRKSAFYAYQTAVFFLNNAQFTDDLTPTTTTTNEFMEAYQFDSEHGRLYVAWQNPYGTGAVSEFQIPGESVSIYGPTLCNASGCSLSNPSRTITGVNGVVTVPVDDQPIYILVNE